MKSHSYNLRGGSVVKWENGIATVALHPQKLSSECAKKGCSLCSTEKITVIKVISEEELPRGREVAISIPKLDEALAAAIAFALPIGFALLFFIIATIFLKMDMESNTVIFGTLISLFLAIPVIKLADIIIFKKQRPLLVKSEDIVDIETGCIKK